MSALRFRRLACVAVTTAVAASLSAVVPTATATPTTTATATTAAANAAPAAGGVPSTGTAGALEIENSFVSDQGWVKPGDEYISRIILTNTGAAPVAGAEVTITAPTGSTFVSARGAGTHPVTATQTVWNPGPLAGDATETLFVDSIAATTAQEPTIVWRDLSTTAVLTALAAETTVTSHGPR